MKQWKKKQNKTKQNKQTKPKQNNDRLMIIFLKMSTKWWEKLFGFLQSLMRNLKNHFPKGVAHWNWFFIQKKKEEKKNQKTINALTFAEQDLLILFQY